MFIAASAGCSTTILTQGDAPDREAAMERAALIEAADALSQTKWPKPQQVSWASRLTGVVGGDERISKSEAAAAYLAALGDAPGRTDSVFTDAGAHLAAAGELIEAAEIAAIAPRPAMADVAVIEGAISDLRQTRDIYVACLKELAKQGDAVASDDIRSLKTEFDSAIEEIGAVADRLADSVANDQSETFAGPRIRKDFAGSL